MTRLIIHGIPAFAVYLVASQLWIDGVHGGAVLNVVALAVYVVVIEKESRPW